MKKENTSKEKNKSKIENNKIENKKLKTTKIQNNKAKVEFEEKHIKEKNNESKKHNGIISFWKFMFCLMIIIHHGKVFGTENSKILLKAGNIGVEFFFIISGYLLGKKALNSKDDNDNLGKETLSYIFKKIKTFLPYSIIASIFLLIIFNIYENMSIFNNIISIFDILLLQMSGIKTYVLNGPIWYISSMLLCMLILYPLIRKYKYNFVYLFLPITILFITGYVNKNGYDIMKIHKWVNFTFLGNIRAFADLSIGVLLYTITEKVQKLNFKFLGKIIITFIELIGFILPFIIELLVKNPYQYQNIIILLLSISTIIAFSEKALEYNIMCNKLFYFLEKLSLGMYFFHIPICKLLIYTKFTSKFTYVQSLSIFILFTLIFSIIMTYVIDYLKKKNFYLNKLKEKIIEI